MNNKKAGALLWRRMQITVTPGTFDVDTGLTQVNKSFNADSVSEPPLGVNATVPVPDGTPPASRVQVIPMAPYANWTAVAHGEPYFNTVTGTVHVPFHTTNEGTVTVNALFWDPHTMAGPGQADTYH